MTNYEYYKEQMERITRFGRCVAMKATTSEIVCCADINCDECLFRGSEDANCSQKAFEWAEEEYKEPEIDWSKVPVDTPVLVSNYGINWVRRHFAKVTSLGTIWVYSGGKTSWSVDTMNPIIGYKYAKLAEVK